MAPYVVNGDDHLNWHAVRKAPRKQCGDNAVGYQPFTRKDDSTVVLESGTSSGM